MARLTHLKFPVSFSNRSCSFDHLLQALVVEGSIPIVETGNVSCPINKFLYITGGYAIIHNTFRDNTKKKSGAGLVPINRVLLSFLSRLRSKCETIIGVTISGDGGDGSGVNISG